MPVYSFNLFHSALCSKPLKNQFRHVNRVCRRRIEERPVLCMNIKIQHRREIFIRPLHKIFLMITIVTPAGPIFFCAPAKMIPYLLTSYASDRIHEDMSATTGVSPGSGSLLYLCRKLYYCNRCEVIRVAAIFEIIKIRNVCKVCLRRMREYYFPEFPALFDCLSVHAPVCIISNVLFAVIMSSVSL